ncbi:DUF6078 family protein [Bacteroides helcogenes]|uniref:Uncharacterized protein n=1 Tax=Bacteroides helcogenes (strain ATCC 35417 / DSM 20613 / JCM 6297 / CCUG 15421 / P 36-108) TaxID=693979 RepID=E6SQZ9_BACT6|nr:DUF6078 family protein [Bacteroides helcogenes]ADV45068.1 hypothetical protein Bache_3143 [Bacteroides helcogenes P 36-108]MDY5239926.1 DUF6078 family protein [Bacteroides helcogenes]
MNETLDYATVPYDFDHCQQAQCPQADTCLRRLAAIHAPKTLHSMKTVNPNNLPADLAKCPYFLTTQKVRIAWGIKDFLNRLPLEDAKAIRRTLIYHFTKTHYYRLQRKERYLRPEEQEYIRQLFRRYGVTDEPTYEYYTEEYNWSTHNL